MVNSIPERSFVADHVVITVLQTTATCNSNPISKTQEDVHEAVHQSFMDENSPLLPCHTKESSLSRLDRAWKWYQQRLSNTPILTKSLTAAVLVGCGDLAGQCIEIAPGTTIDVWRVLRFALMGLILQAPITHYYYLLLDAKLPPTPSPWTMTTLVKLMIDQLLWAPSFTLAIFVFMGILQAQPVAEIVEQIKLEYGTVLICNWKLWVPAAVINMAWCPPELRVLYCNIIFFVWSIMLSILLNASTDAHQWQPVETSQD